MRKSTSTPLAEVTTCHGVRDFWESSSIFSRIGWSSILIICFSFLFLQLYAFGSDILSAKWDTRSFINKIQEPLKFPDIFVCNFNNFRASKIAELNMSAKSLSFVNSYFGQMYPFGHINSIEEEIDAAQEYKKWSETIKMNYTDHIFYMTHQCNDTILSIRYLDYYPPETTQNPCANLVRAWEMRDDTGNAEKTRSARGMMAVFQKSYGICYIILPNYVSEKTGEQSGMYVMLNTEIDEYPSTVENQPLTEGFRIELTHGPWDSRFSFSLPPGFHIWVSMRQWRHTATNAKLHVFTRPCIYQSELAGGLFITKYPQHSCYDECMYDAVRAECGCGLNSDFNGSRTCEPWEYAKCIGYDRSYKPSVQSLEKEHPDRSAACFTNCAPLCDRTGVDAHVHYGVIPTHAQRRNAGHIEGTNLTVEDFKKNIASMNIYYNTLDVDVLEHYERYTLDNIVARIGGLLGVWIGASVITIIQAILYGFHALVQMIYRPAQIRI